ncbi:MULTISPECIES: dihydrodipicolinate synthase family protein [Streptomyces]|uniref:Dihydrodipicolinate synthase family protein n=1 Tax=Streptomyces dengpaensis TaxID=2049881 RepID=A0ABM6T1C3_9ACTN|nr:MULTISPECIES: dihydrodipicolinate synthase family protein [Streptomyces]AVH60657.1 dihydrodipicolinate synthase family protein [Streptomyces dengpaensis]PIB03542.1 dihydrodipicolinate synthase family protein [Streptomyces sp. HG99]
MPEKLAPGVWGVVATPFLGSALEVDEPSLARLVEHYARIGTTGLTVLGVFGEAARLSAEERRAVLETVVDTVGLPLVVGVTGLATAPVLEEARLVREMAGDRLAGLMVQVNSPDPQVVAAHLNAVHDATGAGIVVQDYPETSQVAIRTADLVRAVRAVPSAVAVKAEAPPTPAAVARLTAELDVPVFGGLGGLGLLDELAAGAAGAMTGFSCPEGLIACVQAWRSGGYDAAREAYLPYLPLVNFEAQAGIGLALRKEAIRRRGLITESGVRPPAAQLPEALVPQLERHLAALPKEVR